MIKTARLAIPEEFDKLILDQRLLELDQGDWTEKYRSEVYSHKIKRAMNKDNWRFKAPNGESQEEVSDRMSDFVSEKIILRNKKDLKIGVFGHGVSI